MYDLYVITYYLNSFVVHYDKRNYTSIDWSLFVH